jgi:prephenate dehydratase
VALRTWRDDVVHVHVYSCVEELSQTRAPFAEHRFGFRDADATAEAAYVVRSSPESPVMAADVAQALVGAQVRASSMFDRPEWSVDEL